MNQGDGCANALERSHEWYTGAIAWVRLWGYADLRDLERVGATAVLRLLGLVVDLVDLGLVGAGCTTGWCSIEFRWMSVGSSQELYQFAIRN